MTMATREVRIVISADVASAIRAMSQVEGGLGGINNAGRAAETQSSSFADKLKDGLSAAGVVGGFGLVVAGFKSVVDQGRAYEANMNTLQAVTGASAAEMTALGDKAKELGNDVSIPGASAATAAEALRELAKGGLSVEQSMAAATGTLRLAAAAQVSGGEAAQIQANALNAFRLSGDQANHVADLLANAANAASGEASDMASALQQAATVASGFGLDIDETTTSLALFAKNGVLGSDAGTSLKTMLTSLASPTNAQSEALATLGVTAFDASGKFSGMETITKQLATAHQRLTTEQYAAAASTAFGTDAVRAANILGAEGTAGWTKMADAVGKAGGAQELAAAQSQGLNGAIDRLANAASNTALTLFEYMAPALTGLVDVGTSVVNVLGDAIGLFGNLPAPVQAGALALGALILLKGPLLGLWMAAKASGVGLAIQGEMLAARLSIQSLRLQAAAAGTSMSALAAGMRVAGVAAVGLGNSLKAAFLSNPIGLALVAATTALTFFMSSTDDASEATQNYTDVIDDQTGALKENSAQLISTKVEASGLGDKWRALGGDTSILVDAIGGVPGALEKANAFIETNKSAALEASAALAGYADGSTNVAAANGTAALSFNQTTVATGQQSTGYRTATEAGELLNTQLGLMSGALENQKNVTAGATGELGRVAGATDTAAAATEELAQAAELAKDPTKFFSDALKAAAENAQILADSTGASVMLSEFKTEADKATRAADLFAVALDTLDGRSRSLDDATADQQATLAALTEAWEAGTKAATDNAEAGNLNTQALRDWDVQALTATSDGRSLYAELGNMADQHVATAAAAYSDAAATGDVAAAAVVARETADESRAAFIELAAQHFGNEQQAIALADKLGIVDGTKIDDKFFQTINDDALAQEKLRAAQSAVIDDKRFQVLADAASAQRQADNLNRTLTEIDGKTVEWFAVGNIVIQRAGTADAQNVADATAIRTASGQIMRADGGWVTGPGGPRDDKVKARLSPGEFVVNAAQAGKHGGLLEAINDGEMGFADGGSVPNVPAGATGASAAVAVQGAVSIPDVAAIEAAWEAIGAAVMSAWTAVILPSLDALSVATLRTGAEFEQLQTESVEPSWAENAAAVDDAVNVGILPAYGSLNAGSQFVGAEMWRLHDGSVAPVWSQTGQLITATWAGPIAGTYGALNAGTANVGTTFQQLAGSTGVSWGQIGATITGTYNGAIVPAWTGVQGFATATGGFFTGVASGVSTATGQVTGDIREITGAIDEFFKMVDGKAPATTTPAVTATVRGPAMQAFADGGLLSGPGGPRDDKLVIRASPGEFVVNAKATAEHLPELTAINNGSKPTNGGAFADGGLVGDKIGSNIKGAIEAGAQKAIGAGVDRVVSAMAPAASTAGGFASNGNWGPVNMSGLAANAAAAQAYIKANFGGVASIGGWRASGSVAGSDHPSGKALDVMIANYRSAAGIAAGDSVADWFIRNPNSFGTKYVIWRDRINQGGTWKSYSHPGGNNDTLAHRDHVHLSFLTGAGQFQGAASAPVPADDDPDTSTWLGQMVAKIKAGGAGAATPAGVGVSGSGAAAMNTVDPIRDHGPQNMARGTMDMVGPVPPGGREDRWGPMVEGVLTLKGKPLGGNKSRAMYQMHTESGGDPLAYNDWDSNFKAGHPSKGLWQTIPTTFRRWADPGFNTNIWHPESNFRAASNYVDANYNGIFPGRAYDNGGILPPGITMAYNGTGQDEMHLTNSQWQTARTATLAAGNTSSGPATIEVNNYMDWANQDVRTEVLIDGKFSEFAQVVNRQEMQSV